MAVAWMIRSAVIGCGTLAAAACAKPPPADPADAAEVARPAAIDPVGGFAQMYGISRDDAQVRLDNQERVSALAEALRRDPLPGFSDLWIEHEPRYAVVVAFKGAAPKAEVLRRADPKLRPFLEFREAKRDKAAIDRDLDRLIAAFRDAPVQWAGGYDVKTGRFGFDFATEAGADWARARVPDDLKADVDVRMGPVPTIEPVLAPRG